MRENETTTKGEHTPGPWLLRVGEEHCLHAGNRVAVTAEWQDGEESGEATVAEVWRTYDDGDLADGALIAAAPALLEALEDALLWLDTLQDATTDELAEGLRRDRARYRVAILAARGGAR